MNPEPNRPTEIRSPIEVAEDHVRQMDRLIAQMQASVRVPPRNARNQETPPLVTGRGSL